MPGAVDGPGVSLALFAWAAIAEGEAGMFRTFFVPGGKGLFSSCSSFLLSLPL